MILNSGFGGCGGPGVSGSCLLLSVCLLLLQARADLASTKDRRYSWKTGQWGRCMGEECGSGGLQSRAVWCIHAEGWNTHPSNCRHADRPESQRPCFKVCEWHQDLFEWELSEWGPCVLALLPSSEPRHRSTECITAQHGLQRRSARCVRAANGTAVTERICEFFSLQPALEQACLIPCPRDCMVSDFSPWSDCSRSCGSGLQHRTRHVLAAPMYGGAGCPNLTQTRPCRRQVPCPAGDGGHGYSLKVAPWSECRRPQHKDLWLGGRTTLDFGVGDTKKNTVKRHDQSSQHHRQHHLHHPHLLESKTWDVEIGYQSRQVRCMGSDGKNAIMSLCTLDDGPRTFQSCIMPKDCQTSDWSVWSPCSKTCRATDLSPGYRVRTRKIMQPVIGGGKECPSQEEKEACNIIGDLLPKCPRYVWRSTEWGECRVAPLLSQQDPKLENASVLCGGGIQTRETYCIQVPADSVVHHRRDVSRPVSAHLCGDGVIPSAVQSCSIPCAQPCLLSSWSSWGACLHDNCLESQGRKGYRQRRRQVLGEVSGSTENCAHLLESMPCDDPTCFLWKVQAEGVCVSSDNTCGQGTRNQTLTCVSSQGEPVEEGFCEEDPPPVQVACEIACRGDCVVSSWSDWSSCSHSCTNKNAEGRQSRVRSVLAWPGEGGRACPPATSLEQWRPCNHHPCVVLFWETSAWGPCVEDPSVALNGSSTHNETSTCAVGVQTRTVTCVKTNTGPVLPKRCPDSVRPDSVRPCVLACRTDCLVTPFSEWTTCPTACMPANVTTPTQSRYRTIIQRAANGGQECPDTLFEERECEALPVCPIYRWRTHRWQPCTLVPESARQEVTGSGQSCGRGLETRALSCVDEKEEVAVMSECVLWAGPTPTQVRSCWVSCRDDCTFTTWSTVTECTGCGSSRTRKRSLTGRSRKREHCHREDLYPLVDTQLCPCVELLLEPWGSWSPCILPEAQGSLQAWKGQKEASECGRGLRYRAVACLDQRGRLHDPVLCNGSELQDESCHVSCPLDCRLSSWSAWSPCSASCGSGLKVRSKWLREKPFNAGRPCPKLDLKNQAQVYEAVPCRSECGVYEWVSESWSLCAVNSVDKLPACGEGVQSRKIRCVMRDSVDPGRTLNDSLCDPDDMPSQAQTCVLPCPGDCVMSPWSHWSPCPTPCDSNTVRTRSRQVLRPSAGDAVCPESDQTEPCVANSNCFTYQYNVSDWSTCMLNENAVCGKGIRLRLLDCMRSDARVVTTHMCEELGLSQPWKLVDTCQVDCPISCLLSEWSLWTECSHTCGNQGVMARTRRVLQEPHEEGRPCASQLSQTMPCPVRPCYSWLLGDWSPCHVEGADCGEGERKRNLSCIVHWGHWPQSPGPRSDVAGSPLVVEEERCGERLQRESEQELQQPCFVPCPGDCHLTEWSSWSSCHLTCLEGRSFEAVGQQARSRAVVIQAMENQESCPPQVFETRPCKGGKCHSFEWRTSSWNNNERVVWCQRSDGVNVTGGCFAAAKPAGRRHCHPPCTKPFSQCKQSGVCGCEQGYTEVMTTHGFLDYCTKTPGGENRKADVKTSAGRLKPGPSHIQDFFSDWSLQALSPDGRIKMWVYGATAGGFVLILFIIVVSFLLCSRPGKQNTSLPPPQKALALAYDGDVDM